MIFCKFMFFFYFRERQNGNQHVVSVENGSSLAITNIKVTYDFTFDSFIVKAEKYFLTSIFVYIRI